MPNRPIPRGAVIFSEGDSSDCAYLVEDGWIEIFVELGGQKHPLSLVGPGEIFGEMGLIDGAPRSASASVAEDCQLLRISAEQFMASLDHTQPFHVELLRKLSVRFRDAQRRMLDGIEQPRVESSGMGPGFASLAKQRDIAEAVGRQEIEPFFQPIVHIGTGAVHGFEALARWRCPGRGMLPPLEFLPLAERTGLVRRIDLAMADRSMAILAKLDGPHAPYVNLNFSAWHFRDDGLVGILRTMLERHGLAPSRVRVELTETLMVDNPQTALRIMTALKELGLRLALDDFGTGYSSLSVLHGMPIDVLKIDRSMTQGITTAGRPRIVLRNVVALAHDLGMAVVAEGIEDTDTVDALLEIGCTLGQGFLFAVPAPAEEAVRLAALAQEEGGIRWNG